MKMKRSFGILFLVLVLFASAVGSESADRDSASVGEKVAAAIRSYVAGRLDLNENDIRVRLIRPAEGAFIAKELEVKEGARGGLLGRVVFLVSSKSEGRPAAHQWVAAEVEMIRSVVVAVRPLRRSQVIGPEDIEVRPFAITRVGEAYFLHPDALIGKRLIRSIGAGLPISSEMIEVAPVILPGDRVTLVVETGGLRITTGGRAKEEGFLGKPVAVVNLDSQKTVYGEVIDSSTVKVFLPK